MERNKELDDILELLAGQRLGLAIEYLESFFCKYPELGFADVFDGIKNDYRLMADYWAGGYRDPQLDGIYRRLTRYMYSLTSNVMLRHIIAHVPFFSSAHRAVAASRRDWTVAAIQRDLEEFVSEVAMLQFEPEHIKREKKARIYAGHQSLMSELFNRIWLSEQWTEEQSHAYEELMLSPTVDVNDRALMVSAVMLSAMNVFDVNKLGLLINVYRRSMDDKVSQRALVGWVFSLGKGKERLFPEERQMVEELLKSEKVCEELTELQIQLLYCVSAESDNNTIQKEIIPDLLKNNNFHITRNGIEERDEDPMQDIFHPEESESNMEKVEQSFRRMVDMQKAGSDIYFGGFSQMKRFPFFDNISNWFVPFYKEHPAVAPVCDSGNNGKLVQKIIGSGPFCDSDKYSFVLAFTQVIDRIPQSMREMIGNGEVAGVARIMDIDNRSAAYIRRIYLQDIYRFFRLYPSRAHFYNPFDYRKGEKWHADYIFFAHSIFKGTALSKKNSEIVTFLMKRRMYGEAAEVLDCYADKDKDYQYYMLCGNVLLHKKNVILHDSLSGYTASECFRKAMECRPDDKRALMGYARACFYEGNYVEACDAYGGLMEKEPDKKSYLVGYGVCLTNLERYDEALKVLYRLDYEYPEDYTVRRVLARALVGDGKYEQAKNIYLKLSGGDNDDAEDIVNFGFCEWFAGNNREAARLFARYLKTIYPNSTTDYYRERAEAEIIRSELGFIENHGVGMVDIQLMLDLISVEILR